MVSTRSGRGSAPSQLPSFEELFSRNHRRPLLTNEAKRIRWVLDGPLETAISVMNQPYHEPDTDPELYWTSSGEWHALAQKPYTEPKVSSINVSVTQIDDWEDQWRELHLGCTDPPSDDEGEDEDGENYDFPSGCCEEQRPHPQDMTLVVKASKEFVTIYDYVSAVHPWLMRKYDDLLGALAVLDDGQTRLSLPAGEHLMVTFGGPDLLSVGTKEEWLSFKDKETYLRVGQTPVVAFAGTDLDKPYVEGDDWGPADGWVGPWPGREIPGLSMDPLWWVGGAPGDYLHASYYGPPPYWTKPWPPLPPGAPGYEG
jgi:hypothetical protein